MVSKPVWQDFFGNSKKWWDYLSEYNSKIENKTDFSSIIANSYPAKDIELKINVDLIYGIDLDITFIVGDIKSNIWFTASMNWIPNIYRFLEAIACANEKEYFFFCDEEGPYSFLYAQNLSGEDIRFIHLSTQKLLNDVNTNTITEDYKIRQDIIIDKKIFVKIFYQAIINTIKKVPSKDQNDYDYQRDEFKILKQGSKIIEECIRG